MFKGVEQGAGLLLHSFQLLRKHPSLIVPLVVVWLFFAVLLAVLVLDGRVPDKLDDAGIGILLAYGIGGFCLFVMAQTLAAAVVVGVLRESALETDPADAQSVSLQWHRVVPVLGKQLPRLIVLALVWSMLWLLIIVATSSGSDRREQSEYMRRMRRWLNRAVRLGVFLIMPALLWDHKGLIQAAGEAKRIVRSRLAEFATIFLGSGLFSGIAAIPVIGVAYAMDQGYLGETVAMVAILVWLALTTGVQLYIEQIACAGLYGWHRNWVEKREQAFAKGLPEPSPESIPMPRYLQEGGWQEDR